MEKKRNDPIKEIATPESKSTQVLWKLDEKDKRFLRDLNISPD